ncbi:MAG: SufE family protein [Alphaproteobacteria bacterium]|nr:SufE family protein [Alphaproteobacteria bacterium]
MKYLEIKNILNKITDPVDRLEFVMDLGMRLSPIPGSALCTEVRGCASRVQICHDNGIFYGDADSALVRGIVMILLAMANDGISDLRSEFGSLKLNLGAGRLNGVEGIIKELTTDL